MNFRLAQPSDDGPIMDLFNHIPVEGSWKIRYMKSPSYLDALKLQGHQTFTLVGEKNGKIMAVVSAVYQKVWVKNLCLTVGYITDVRVYPDHRSGFALRKGIKTMEEISMQQKAHFHYATLIDDNSLTKKVFGANRPGIPRLYDQGRITTFVFPLKRKKQKAKLIPPFILLPATQDIHDEINQIIREESLKRNLFPETSPPFYPQEWMNDQNFMVLRKGEEIAAICGLFDHTSQKKYVVENYPPTIRYTKKIINLYLKAKGLHGLPRLNEPISMLYASFLLGCNESMTHKIMMLAMIKDYLSESPYQYLSLAVHEKDNFYPALIKSTPLQYHSRLYTIGMKGDQAIIPAHHLQNMYVDLLRL